MEVLPDLKYFDVLVMGAGISGLCATLRLLDLGYRVALVEQELFPRAQIGESLSPGIHNIFEYLKVGHLLAHSDFYHDVPSQIVWEQKASSVYPKAGQKNGVIVNRAVLDKSLLEAAKHRGAVVFQPAKVHTLHFSEDVWHLDIHAGYETIKLKSTIVVDARGKKGVPLHQKIQTAPTSIALWTHFPESYVGYETKVEAVSEGWIWASPIPQSGYRVMAFADTDAFKRQEPSRVYECMLKESSLLATLDHSREITDLQTCTVQPYAHIAPWTQSYLRIGEAAFALDPLSSTGVEKAMRFALQAVVAIHTYLKNNGEPIAKAFYEEKLIESVLTHTHWTRTFYKTAWAHENESFWRKRSDLFLDCPATDSPFASRLVEGLSNYPVPEVPKPRQAHPINLDRVLWELRYHSVRLCSQLHYKDSFCIENDLVIVKKALMHPTFARECVYIDQIEVKPLLDSVQAAQNFEELLGIWSQQLPPAKAKKLMVFLWDQKILQNT